MQIQVSPGPPADGLTYEFPELMREGRLRELMLYIADRCQDDPRFGATKLVKILFWSDFLSYLRYGVPITGERYMRLPNGPVPRHYLDTRDEMVNQHEIHLREAPVHDLSQHRIVPVREPDLSKFSARDIALVDRVIEALSPYNAAQVSLQSHGWPWLLVGDREDIPYEAIFLSDEPPTETDMDWAQALIQEHGWDA